MHDHTGDHAKFGYSRNFQGVCLLRCQLHDNGPKLKRCIKPRQSYYIQHNHDTNIPGISLLVKRPAINLPRTIFYYTYSAKKTTTESSGMKPVEVMTMWWQDGNSAMDEILAVLAVRLSSCQVNRTIHVFRVWEKHLLINKNFVRLKYILPTDYTITGVKSPASPIFNRRGLETFQGDMNIHEAIGRNRDTFGWTSWIRMYSCKA